RSQKNYAGHRLSPWLGHLMVSRQESARPLMTVGEVMQLPTRDEVIMVAGCPPVRARKARYFRDRRFVERVMPPPDPAQLPRPVRPDDWSGRPSPVTPPPEETAPSIAPDKSDDADSDESLGTGRKWSREHDPADAGKHRARTAPDLFSEELPPDPEARDRADLTRIGRQAGLDRGNDLGL
ncbi:type IV secretory system conjugative DNA transfer family protein, partial [Neoasaia chiangmaiensis]